MRDFPREFLKSVFLYALENDTSPRLHHITRLSMYHSIKSCLLSEKLDGDCLSISGSLPLCAWLGIPISKIVKADYPLVDCTKLPYADGSFDIYVSDQVLEHVEGSPFVAFDEAYRVLRPEGVAIFSTCFINPVHGHPSDFWRFTKESLLLLSERAGFKVISNGAWGNRLVWTYVNLGLRMEKIPENKNNPVYQLALLNEDDVPIVTWVVVRK